MAKIEINLTASEIEQVQEALRKHTYGAPTCLTNALNAAKPMAEVEKQLTEAERLLADKQKFIVDCEANIRGWQAKMEAAKSTLPDLETKVAKIKNHLASF